MGELMSPQSRRPSIDVLAAGQIDEADLRALQELAALYETLDPVPTGLVDRIKFGITLDSLHAEIAELVRSSDLVGVRSGEATETQTVTFSSTSLTTMVTITPTSADRVRIDGWADPGAGVSVELRTSEATLQTTADEDGRFVFEEVPRGLAQFVLRAPAGSSQAPVFTPSIEI
jgi:hypothetical protein